MPMGIAPVFTIRPNVVSIVSETALLLEDIVVAFGALKAVNNVSIRIRQGERRAIIGPNGAGKTTLFNAVTGLHPPTSGKIIFEQKNITKLPAYRRARLGISQTFQITNLFPTLTVHQNMLLALYGNTAHKFSLFGQQRMTGDEAVLVEEALSVSGLSGRVATAVQELSYGEQRQLELAMALVTQPEILLLDEPAAGLSPAERGVLTAIIDGLPRELTMIMIEHDMDLVLRLVDWVTCLNNGEMLAEGSPVEISQNEYVRDVYLGRARE